MLLNALLKHGLLQDCTPMSKLNLLDTMHGKQAYGNVLSVRLSDWLAHLLDQQCGFRPDRSTVDALQSHPTLRFSMGQRQDSAHLHARFDQGLCYSGLIDAPRKLVALLKDLQTHHSAVIRSEVDSAPVDTGVGFKQG